MPQSPSVGYSRAPEACHKGVYGSRVGRRGYRLLKRELKTVHVAIPITFFKDAKTGKYSIRVMAPDLCLRLFPDDGPEQGFAFVRLKLVKALRHQLADQFGQLGIFRLQNLA